MSQGTTIDWSKYDQSNQSQPQQIDWSKYDPTPQGASPSFWESVKKWAFPNVKPSGKSLGEELREQDKLIQEGKGTNPGAAEGAELAGGLTEWDKASGGEIGGGIHDILKGDISKGLHRILSGTGHAMTPATPFMIPAAVSAPLATGASIGGGVLGSKALQSGAEALGATPDQAQLAGDIGGFAGGYSGAKLAEMAPSALSRVALLGKTPEEAYQSALKPSTTTRPAKLQSAIETGLKEGIPVSKAGVEKLNSLLEDLQDKVTAEINAGAGAGKTVNPFAVTSRLTPTAQKFATQVNPEADLNAVSEAGNEFLRNNPREIPIADAQAMKVGTYQQLGNKAYGEMQTATKESQKALARGLKEEIAAQIPELSDLNARESKLYDLEGVLERAVKRIDNHQLMGIGTPLVTAGAKAVTGSNKIAAAAGIFKAVLDNPTVKSRLAIALSQTAKIPPSVASARVLALANGLGAAASSSETPSDQNAQQ